MNQYDFIIVGSGSGGSVVAYRLSEVPDVKILVIEAGGTQIPEAVDVPYRWAELNRSAIDWAYMSEPQAALGGQRVYCPGGRLIGGSTNLYHMIHLRGHPMDYDNWSYDGCPGWSFNECLPYFQKIECQTDDTNPTAGKSGPIQVISAKDQGNPASQTFIDACLELGYEYTADFNHQHLGAGWHHLDIKDGRRHGARSAYLEPALQRSNVTLSANSLATRLLLEGTRCVGVEYLQDGQVKQAHAAHEVILCASGIQTPKLLMLSGIGNPDHLQEFGIETRVSLPGVGENFHDHALVIGPVAWFDRPAPDPKLNMSEVALFLKSDAAMLVPDIEIGFISRAQFQETIDARQVLLIPGLSRPLSRGRLWLASSDPTVPPCFNPNYLSERADYDRLVQSVVISRDILRTKAFAAWGLTETRPGPSIRSEADLRNYVREVFSSYFHYAGACKMGTDNLAVVDPHLRVHGVEGLRIADASVMPAVPSGNCQTPILMIGERAADFIKRETLGST